MQFTWKQSVRGLALPKKIFSNSLLHYQKTHARTRCFITTVPALQLRTASTAASQFTDRSVILQSYRNLRLSRTDSTVLPQLTDGRDFLLPYLRATVPALQSRTDSTVQLTGRW